MQAFSHIHGMPVLKAKNEIDNNIQVATLFVIFWFI